MNHINADQLVYVEYDGEQADLVAYTIHGTQFQFSGDRLKKAELVNRIAKGGWARIPELLKLRISDRA